MSRIKLLLPVFLSAALIFSASPAYGNPDLVPQDEITSDTVNYKTTQAVIGDFAAETRSNGNVYFPQRTTVLYEGENAKYVQTLVSSGDRVSAGDPLVEISVERDTVSITEAEVKLQRMKEDFETGKNDRGTELTELRTKLTTIGDNLEHQKAALNIQRKEAELSRYMYEQERDIAKQEKEIEKLKERNDLQYVTAPIDGVIYDLVYYQKGTPFSDGIEICTIADTSFALVKIQNADYRYGCPVSLSVNSAKLKIDLKATVVAAPNVYPDLNMTGCLAEVRLDDPALPINPKDIALALSFNQYLKIDVTGVTKDLKQVLILDKTAVTQQNGKELVTILDPDGSTTHRRQIKTGTGNMSHYWVLRGIEAGDNIVLN